MSLFSKVKKAVKKGLKVATVINPALGGGFSKTNAMQGQLLTAGMGAFGGPVSMPGGANPLASIAGMLGEKIGLPANLTSSVASSLLPMPGGNVVDDVRAYAAWKIAPDSVLQNLNLAGGGVLGKKRRRMNPLNARAAKRAIRRIKAVRKITAGIERALPKAKARNYGHSHFHGHRR
jgi:hypothetical protein